MSIPLEIVNLKKSYGTVVAVKNLSFLVNEKEVFGILGPNGAGKTTILECIEGLRTYESGEIKVFGQNIRQHPNLHRLTGIQTQTSSLPENITVREAMTLFCKWQETETRVDLLQDFGFGQVLNKQYGALSTGQKRRLHLAIAIAHQPKLLFLDEPTAGLDVEARVKLHQELKRLKQEGMTMVLASHDMAEVETLCDRIAVIISGKLAFIGTPAELTAAGPESKITIKTRDHCLEGSPELQWTNKLKEENGYTTLSTANIASGLEELLGLVKLKQDQILDLRVERLSLEERFIELVTEEREGE